MARGGARVGAGRKPGAATQRSRAIADQLSVSGLAPLQVMTDAMSYFHRVALQAIDDNQGRPTKDAGEAFLAAASIAKDAAPFMHPRLTPVGEGDKTGEQKLVHVDAPEDGGAN